MDHRFGYTGRELARRFGSEAVRNSINRNKLKLNFADWTQAKDPEGKAWAYREDTGMFYLLPE